MRFENVSKVELGALLWVLELAADDDYRLKLGMGKPLGMGAVKIESEVTLSDRAARYNTLFAGDTWATGAEQVLPIAAFEQQTQCITEFESYVVDQSGDMSGSGKLRKNLRIQCLLALLRWPGPQSTTTRYMEIERDVRQGVIDAAEVKRNEQKVNEYKLRPVLPLPLQVTGEIVASFAKSTPAQPTVLDQPPQPVAPSRPAGPQLPAVGDVFTGKVLEVGEDAVLVEVPGFAADRVTGVLRAEVIEGGRTTRFRVGNAARVEVTGVRQLKSGRTILELKPGAKKQ